MERETQDRLRIAVIVGSVREGRFAPVVANWFMTHAAQRPDMEFDLVDLAVTPVPSVLPRLGEPHSDPAALNLMTAVTPRLDSAEAFVMITPEYNHSYPAALKNLIDWHGKEWHAKPVGFVSYGGVSGGLRAVEHLRGVMAETHSVTIRESVCFPGAWSQFDEDGQAVNPASVAALKVMLDQLAWWAKALRDARAADPYTVSRG